MPRQGMAGLGGGMDDQKGASAAEGGRGGLYAAGDNGASNTDPYATKPTPDNAWVVSGPHIMLLPTDRRQLDAFPTDPHTGSPWVMWKDTPYAHIMVPTAAMPKAASAAQRAPKASKNR